MSHPTRLTYNGDGATTIFAVSFPYIDKSHVHVYVNAVEVFGFTWPTLSQVQLTSAPTAGSNNVIVQRITPRDSLPATIQNGTISPDDINANDLQLLYCEQEDDTIIQLNLGALNDTLAARDQAVAAENAILALSSLYSLLAGAAAAASPAIDILSAPPGGGHNDGDTYLIGNAPTGLWVGMAGRIAKWSATSNTWGILVAKTGQRVFVQNKLQDYSYAGSRWNKVLIADEKGAFQDFSDVPDGTHPGGLVMGSGHVIDAEGAGAATAVITGGAITATDNVYNVIPFTYKSFHVSAEFTHRVSGAPQWCISCGILPIITKMVHISGGQNSEPTITLWGATIVSPGLSYLFETDIPTGKPTVIRGPGAYPAIGEKFRADVIIAGDTYWCVMRNALGELVVAKGFAYWEVATLVGGYAYVQNNFEDTPPGQPVLIHSAYVRPLHGDSISNVLQPLYKNADPNAATRIAKQLTSGVDTNLFRFTVPMQTNFGFVVTIKLSGVPPVQGYSGVVAKYICAGGNFDGGVNHTGPTNISTAHYTENSGVIDINLTSFTFHDDGSGVARFSMVATKSGTNSSNAFINAELIFEPFPADNPTLVAL